MNVKSFCLLASKRVMGPNIFFYFSWVLFLLFKPFIDTIYMLTINFLVSTCFVIG